MELKRLLAKIRIRKDVPVSPDPSPLSFKQLESLLNLTALEIFEKYRQELFKKPCDYLVPAIWGGESMLEIDTTQQAIQRILAPIFDKVQNRFLIKGADSRWASRADYLLRSLFFYKMAYMAQYYLNCKGQQDVFSQEKRTVLEEMEPLGRA